MQSKSKSATVILISMITVTLSLLLLILPKSSFSEKENRYLKDFPKLTVESLFTGDYMEDINEYVTDHFPMRNTWISLRTACQMTLGFKCINGVYICKEGYLIEKYNSPLNNEKIINTFNKLGDKIKGSNPDVNISLMIVPTAALLYEDKLPTGATMGSQYDALKYYYSESDIETIDVYSKLLGERKERPDTQLFYKTDHHWTYMGAYLGYLAYCESLNIEPIDIDEMTCEVGTRDFHGTYSSKVLRMNEDGDSITLCKDNDADLIVKYEDSGEITDSIFSVKYLDEKDKYSVFLDNLHAFVTIENKAADTKRELLLIKDSYANSMLPYLVHNFSKIYVLDTRYYKEGVSSFVSGNSEITDILILYNLSTMDNDTGIRGIF